MSNLKGYKTYWRFLGQCAECGHCTQTCESLQAADMTLGEIAKALIACDRASETPKDLTKELYKNQNLTQAVRGCFICKACQNVCFANNNVAELIYAAREDFQSAGLIPRSAWSSVMVDQEWDIFTAYRAIYGIGYPDLTRHIASDYGDAQTDCDVAFFPGCSLAAYAPELTREVFATVEQLGGKTTMIDHCCGSPLKSAGFYDRATALLDVIADEVEQSGAKQVVCVCPGCRNAMQETLQRRGMDVEAVNLTRFLMEHGYHPKKDLSGLNLFISKSCQDRDGTYLDETREILGVDAEDAPAVFEGCCGAGGAVSAFNYEESGAQTQRKLEEVPDGGTVVTMCPTCTYTYAFSLISAPRNVDNKNYLELIFENQFDWDTVSYQLNSMWSGEYGQWLAEVFA